MGGPTERQIDEAYQKYVDESREGLLVLAAVEYERRGRGVLMIQPPGSRPFASYWEAEAFIASNPNNLGEQWAETLRTYDPARQAVVLLTRQDGRHHITLIGPRL